MRGKPVVIDAEWLEAMRLKTLAGCTFSPPGCCAFLAAADGDGEGKPACVQHKEGNPVGPQFHPQAEASPALRKPRDCASRTPRFPAWTGNPT